MIARRIKCYIARRVWTLLLAGAGLMPRAALLTCLAASLLICTPRGLAEPSAQVVDTGEQATVETQEPRPLLAERLGLRLVDPYCDEFSGQVVYMNFDGAQDATYNGPVQVGPFDIPAFTAQAAGLEAQEAQIIASILTIVEEIYDGSGVFFTTSRPVSTNEYSTIIIGGTDSAFRDYGSFVGLAEAVDAGNLCLSDNAFVFSDVLVPGHTDPDVLAEQVANVIARTTGYLLGYAQDNAELGELRDDPTKSMATDVSSDPLSAVAAVAATYWRQYESPGSESHAVATDTYRFGIDGVCCHWVETKWYVNNQLIGSETDYSTFANGYWDPSFDRYIGSDTTIKAKLYDSDGNLEETHIWYMIVCGNNTCDPDENPCNCPQDCYGCCIDDDCNDPGECKERRCANYVCSPTNSPSGTSCGSSNSSGCDAPDTCDGSGSCIDRVDSAGSVCRSASGECDETETCNGSSKSCPSDAKKPYGASCGNSNSSDCDAPDTCNGSGTCIGRVDPAGTVCRNASGECDETETCNGSSSSCPSDGKKPEGTSCGSSSSSGCNAPDTCNGSGTCIDRVDPAGTVCRSASGECDETESCTGSSSSCPSDGKKPSGTACTDDGNECTDDECNGSSTICQHPNNSDPCDDGFYCNGTDTCSNGSCSQHTGDPCDPLDCDDDIDACVDCTNDGQCDDNNPCTNDACVDTYCQHDPICECCVNNADCDDSDPCTNDTCVSNTCQNEPISNCCQTDDDCEDNQECRNNVCVIADCTSDPQCDDGNPCTDDACVNNSCQYSDNNDSCNDNDPCTTDDECSNGECQGTLEPLCCQTDDDCGQDQECRNNRCVGDKECPVGGPCNDNNPCTENDVCISETVCRGTPIDCDDGEFCTGTESCDNGDCVSSGDPCAGDKTCNEETDQCDGQCVLGTMPIAMLMTAIVGLRVFRTRFVGRRRT